MRELPPELGQHGAALWRRLWNENTYDEQEFPLVQRACELEDDLARLRAALADADLIVAGSTGQPVESPLLGSIRNAAALQSKLLAMVKIVDDVAARTPSDIGRLAARARWERAGG